MGIDKAPDAKGNDGRDKMKASGMVGKTLAAGLATMGATGAQAQTPGQGFDDYQSSYLDTHYYSQDFEPRAEALAVFGSLNAELKDSLAITMEQINKLRKNIDAFVATNPRAEGRTEVRPDGRSESTFPSYDPLFELELALTQGKEMNPLVIGFGMSYIKTLRAKEYRQETAPN